MILALKRVDREPEQRDLTSSAIACSNMLGLFFS